MRRLRWRLRGAWLWPTFVVATLLEMVLLHVLPVQGDATGWVGALLAAGCLNLLAVVVVGGIGGFALRRRRPDLPKVVADDYAGTVALGLVAAAFLTAGLVSSADRRARGGLRAQSRAVRDWIVVNGSAFALAHSVGRTASARRGPLPDLRPGARSQAPAVPDRRHDASPPEVRRDRSREPNSGFIPRYR